MMNIGISVTAGQAICKIPSLTDDKQKDKRKALRYIDK